MTASVSVAQVPHFIHLLHDLHGWSWLGPRGGSGGPLGISQGSGSFRKIWVFRAWGSGVFWGIWGSLRDLGIFWRSSGLRDLGVPRDFQEILSLWGIWASTGPGNLGVKYRVLCALMGDWLLNDWWMTSDWVYNQCLIVSSCFNIRVSGNWVVSRIQPSTMYPVPAPCSEVPSLHPSCYNWALLFPTPGTPFPQGKYIGTMCLPMYPTLPEAGSSDALGREPLAGEAGDSPLPSPGINSVWGKALSDMCVLALRQNCIVCASFPVSCSSFCSCSCFYSSCFTFLNRNLVSFSCLSENSFPLNLRFPADRLEKKNSL